MQKYINISVNGDPFNCDSSMSIFDILVYLGFDIGSVIVEYNNSIVDKCNFDSLYLHHGDSLEIISIVGGG